MSSRIALIATLSMALWTCALGAFAHSAHAMPTHARPVALTDSDTAPDYLVYIPAARDYAHDRTVHPRTDEEGRPYVCGHHEGMAMGYFTDASAYRWDGSALGGQRWNATHDTSYWRDTREGGRVTYDGYAFTNHTARGVLVAAWC